MGFTWNWQSGVRNGASPSWRLVSRFNGQGSAQTVSSSRRLIFQGSKTGRQGSNCWRSCRGCRSWLEFLLPSSSSFFTVQTTSKGASIQAEACWGNPEGLQSDNFNNSQTIHNLWTTIDTKAQVHTLQSTPSNTTFPELL